MIDTYSQEWRRICEARWVIRECENEAEYMAGIIKTRGKHGCKMLDDDVKMLRPLMDRFTKKVAAELIEQMKKKA
jgi:hypothetical protein